MNTCAGSPQETSEYLTPPSFTSESLERVRKFANMSASLQVELFWVLVPITFAGAVSAAVGEALRRASSTGESFGNAKATTANKGATNKATVMRRNRFFRRVRAFGSRLETRTQLVTARFRVTSGRNRLERIPKFSTLNRQRNSFHPQTVEYLAAGWLLKTI